MIVGFPAFEKFLLSAIFAISNRIACACAGGGFSLAGGLLVGICVQSFLTTLDLVGVFPAMGADCVVTLGSGAAAKLVRFKRFGNKSFTERWGAPRA